MNLFEVLMKGGWVMIPIVLSSIVVIALGISRFLSLRQDRDKLSKFVNKWQDVYGEGNSEKYKSACRMGPHFCEQARQLFDGENRQRGEIGGSLETLGNQELSRLETGLSTIGTLAAVTPLIGFLGTVTGMIKAFMHIQKLGGNVNANVLAGGIWEALVTTAAGLAVGILALVIHNYLASIVKSCVGRIEHCSEITLRILRSSE